MKKIFWLFALLPLQLFSQNLKLWYEQPAEHFEEALVIGNGTQGATIFGGTYTEKIFLNDLTLWSGEPVNANMNPEAYKHLPSVREALKNENYKLADSLIRNLQGKFSESYAPLGTLYLDFDTENVKDYYRELSLDNASVNIKYTEGDNEITRNYFYSYPDKVMVIRLSSKTAKGINFTLRFDSQLSHTVFTGKNQLLASGRAPTVAKPSYVKAGEEAVQFDSEHGTRFATQIEVITDEGKIKNKKGYIEVKNASEVMLLVSIATSFNGFDKDPEREGIDETALVDERIERVKYKTFEILKNRHEEDYKPYFERVKFTLDGAGTADEMPTDKRLKAYATGKVDKYLETLYFQYGRYLLISSSRTPKVPANLQGLWNPYIRPPWSSNYTMNINAEENYWLAENTNLSEMHQPFLGFIENLEKTGSITAMTFYNAKGWVCHHNSDIWAMTNPVGDFGKGDPVWANWAMGGTWSSTHLWEHYMYTKDKEFLKNKAYPLMKGAAEFCLDMLVKDKNGKYVTSPSTSPENVYVTDQGYKGATLYGATADLAMIRELFMDIIEAVNVMGEDYDFKNKLEEVLVNMHPYQVGKDGSLQEWYNDWKDNDPKHRHQSHLYGLFPGRHINMDETPGLAAACKEALEIKGDETTGWSKGWRINLWARLWDGNRAYKMYRELLRYVEPDATRPKDQNGGGTYPNLFDAHPPFQIDGNFGGAAAVAEMLVQSTPEKIYLLPALPDAWASGSIKGLKTRAGLEIDLTWKDGKLKSYTLKGTPGTQTTITYKGNSKTVKLENGSLVGGI
jgi:alpha-L-fucosidase 2